MRATEARDKKLNRRIAFRVYERANLFYHKLEPGAPIESQPDFDRVLAASVRPQAAGLSPHEPALPASQSRLNDTLNVNISTSGIAFTCKEELKAGDYLMLRILLLSSMTVIVTCCQVVYCKPSNPYEDDRYPFSVGARFANMTAEDTALLDRYIDRRKKQQWVVNGSIASLIAAVLAAPDQALALLMALGHYLLGLVLHLLHLGFEYLELSLDHAVEHLFHTGRHETQIIVFYVLVSFALIILYFLGRKVPSAWSRLSKRLLLFWLRKKSSCLYFWRQQSLVDKIKLIGVSAAAIAAYIYFGI
ncbi:MAG: PilZ domain-containing protein [Methylococcaceae bacterium]|nr:PilZ domain-containing protein [Methylococcaceae bacterium]